MPTRDNSRFSPFYTLPAPIGVLLFSSWFFIIIWNFSICNYELNSVVKKDQTYQYSYHSTSTTFYWDSYQNILNSSIWPRPTGEKYLTWDPWLVGLNNQRMILETMVTFALLLNRQLVLPPCLAINETSRYCTYDFYDMKDMNKILPIITRDQFEERLKRMSSEDRDRFNINANDLGWPDSEAHLVIFSHPRKPDINNVEEYKKFIEFANKSRKNYVHDIYTDPILVEAPILMVRESVFNHFYAFIFEKDDTLNRYLFRLIRSFVHYPSWIWSIGYQLSSSFASFYAIHWRCGDFYYPTVNGIELFKNIENIVPEGVPIYLATDEKDLNIVESNFSKIFQNRNQIFQLNQLLKAHNIEIDPIFHPLLEQILCTRAKVFIGTYYSTLTAYIHRLRGYSPDIENKSQYYIQHSYSSLDIPKYRKNAWGENDIASNTWAQEYRDSWEDIDP